ACAGSHWKRKPRASAKTVSSPSAIGKALIATAAGWELHRRDEGPASRAPKRRKPLIGAFAGCQPQSAGGDVHRHLEAETHLGVLRLGPHFRAPFGADPRRILRTRRQGAHG